MTDGTSKARLSPRRVVGGVRRRARRLRRRTVRRVRDRWQRAVTQWDHDHDIQVSVIVPVYNGMPYLPELLASLERQGLPEGRREIIVVNDGSTDDTAEVLRRFRRRHRRNVVVIDQPNSGWPGGPRNRAMDRARGHWFFFADADDYLADGALPELVDFADRVGADVVLPRVAPAGGRTLGRPFRTTSENVSPVTAFRTFTPHKLIRADFVRRHGLAFPEGRHRLEDGIFFSRAYLLANRIAVLAERDLYYLRAQDGGQNVSLQPIDPDDYCASVSTIAGTVVAETKPGRRRDKLIDSLLRRKVLRFYRPRFLVYPPEKQQRFVELHREFLDRFVSPAVEEALPDQLRSRCRRLRRGDLDGLVADLSAAIESSEPALSELTDPAQSAQSAQSGESAESVGISNEPGTGR